MFLSNKLTLVIVALIGLAGCSSLSPNTTIGFTAMDNYDKVSIETIIHDGKTTKAELNALFGLPINTGSPDLAYLDICKQDKKFCNYSINFGSGFMESYLKTLDVFFDEKNVVVSHRYSETRKNANGVFKTLVYTDTTKKPAQTKQVQ